MTTDPEYQSPEFFYRNSALTCFSEKHYRVFAKNSISSSKNSKIWGVLVEIIPFRSNAGVNTLPLVPANGLCNFSLGLYFGRCSGKTATNLKYINFDK